jgi:hypothetical protein
VEKVVDAFLTFVFGGVRRHATNILEPRKNAALFSMELLCTNALYIVARTIKETTHILKVANFVLVDAFHLLLLQLLKDLETLLI